MEINKIYEGDSLEVLKTFPDNCIDSIVSDPPYGISFMGKKWDYQIPSVELWKEAYRVLKPGGHIIIACGTRTQHRMAVNIEDAGFEIRDLIAWIYGSGFPKSLNIGKAVDKLQGNEREDLGKLDSARDTVRNINIYKKNGNGRLTKGTSEYEGLGTALKPAIELWTLARKPLSEKTVALNVIKWGTGAINIDDCRVELNGIENHSTEAKSGLGNKIYGKFENKEKELTDIPRYNNQGRFPANIIHDGSNDVISQFPNTKSGKMMSDQKRSTGGSPNGIYGKFNINAPIKETIGDSGSAARFFYVAKPSQTERNLGLQNFEAKREADRTKDDGVGGNNPRNRSNTAKHNFHPTVKPITLMKYLCTLITPKNGIILDPFIGSGTTACAAVQLEFNYVGIERQTEYIQLANARIDACKIKETVIVKQKYIQLELF